MLLVKTPQLLSRAPARTGLDSGLLHASLLHLGFLATFGWQGRCRDRPQVRPRVEVSDAPRGLAKLKVAERCPDHKQCWRVLLADGALVPKPLNPEAPETPQASDLYAIDSLQECPPPKKKECSDRSCRSRGSSFGNLFGVSGSGLT